MFGIKSTTTPLPETAIVNQGEVIPFNGIVIDGSAIIDRSAVGISEKGFVGVNDVVDEQTVVLSGSLTIERID